MSGLITEVSAPARWSASTALRLLLRNAYAACLGPFPDSFLLALRDAYVTAPAGSTRRQLLFQLLKCVRYKHPDKRLHSFALPDEPEIRLLNVDSIIVRHLYWFGVDGGTWEGGEIRAWQHFCSRATKILEIGANIGVYTLCGARRAPTASYTAVEPHPYTSRVLRGNLELNQLDRVQVVEAAVVGEKTFDRMTLMIPAADQDETPSGSFLGAGGEVSCHASTSYDVPVAGIRDLMGGVDLLKLDVEGYEFEILNGVRDLLLRDRPTVFVEVLPQARKLQRFIADLSRTGTYRLFAAGDRIQEVNPADLEAGRLQARYGARDALLVPTGSDLSALR